MHKPHIRLVLVKLNGLVVLQRLDDRGEQHLRRHAGDHERVMTTTACADTAAADAAEWPVWSTTARVVVLDPALLDAAHALVASQLADVDRAASRFRDDSELAAVNRAAGRPRQVSPLLADLVQAALDAAELSDGDVDPALGQAMRAIGYDRDFALLAAGSAADHGFRVTVCSQASWRDIRLDGGTLTLPDGLSLDLGATAKAFTADLCARRIARELGTGVLVSLGGDIATAGDGPAGGWRILVSDGDGEPQSRIALPAGSAVATSSTIRRTWIHAGRAVHHILDPVTGMPADPVWRTVTVAAPTCVLANTLSTAAIVRGLSARRWLAEHGTPARLVSARGEVIAVGGWPLHS